MRWGPILRDHTASNKMKLVTWKNIKLRKFRGIWFSFNPNDSWGIAVPPYNPYTFFPKDTKL